jgi:hypothetical protein
MTMPILQTKNHLTEWCKICISNEMNFNFVYKWSRINRLDFINNNYL